MGFSEEKRVRQHFRVLFSKFSRKFEFFHREKFETTFSGYFSQNFVNILSFFTCLNAISSGKRLRQHFSGTFLKISWRIWSSCPFEWDFQWGNVLRQHFSRTFLKISWKIWSCCPFECVRQLFRREFRQKHSFSRFLCLFANGTPCIF